MNHKNFPMDRMKKITLIFILICLSINAQPIYSPPTEGGIWNTTSSQLSQIPCNDTTAWELGTVVVLNDTCLQASGGLPNTICKLLEVDCPGLTPIQVELHITAPDENVLERGTVVFGSGSSGSSFYGDRSEAQILFQELTKKGFRIVDRAWRGSNGWTTREGGLKRESCRYATLLTWVFNNIHETGAFCASGNSGGSAEIGYALTSWNRGDILDLAVPTSGPAVARLDYACQSPRMQEWITMADTIIPLGAMNCNPPIALSPQHGVCLQCSDTPSHEALLFDSVVHPDALLHYPNTRLHFIYGANDCDGPSVPIGLTWSTNVTSEKIIEFVPNTSHVIVLSPEGREAILNAIDKGTTPLSVINEGENTIIFPAQFYLLQNYPNPFNPETIISFQILQAEYVTLKIYNALSEEIVTLVDEYKAPGTYQVKFNERLHKTSLPSGTYYYELMVGLNRKTKKMMLIK
ncbi:MAG: T9SS type A sorting domain-containing protein [Bacteroidetes bacterium]|nr:T9SS type A sorting domain-containing protein [Bacteroidota bacterium]MCL5027676.1 T9SS type A sorting domain-containing protein [Bacteroidota bacterium]